MSTKEELVNGLNEDLAAEWAAIIRYTYQAGKAFGFRGAEFREVLERETKDELAHASLLTDVIVDLGGEPTVVPASFERPEGLKAMLETDLKLELHDVENYKRHARMAEEQGKIGLKVELEDMASDEAGHAREMRRLLKGL